jgi:hypothetical protein
VKWALTIFGVLGAALVSVPLISKDAALLALFWGYCHLGGCEPTTVWSVEARSPDGQYIAQARAIDDTGPGTAGIGWTSATLSDAKGSSPPTEILRFQGEDEYHGDKVQMRWHRDLRPPTRLIAHPHALIAAVGCSRAGSIFTQTFSRSAAMAFARHRHRRSSPPCGRTSPSFPSVAIIRSGIPHHPP